MISQQERETLNELADLRRRITRLEAKEYASPDDILDTFLELTDTPDSYAGSANAFVRVNGGTSALTFGTVDWTDIYNKPTAGTATLGIGAFPAPDFSVNAGTVALGTVVPRYSGVPTAGAITYWTGAGTVAHASFGTADVATLAGTQTFTNKTLTAPVIADFTNAQHDHGDADDGGTLADAALSVPIHAASSKATPVDADELALIDSAASNVLKRLTWANLKATLKTYLDALYMALTGAQNVAGTKTFQDGIIIEDFLQYTTASATISGGVITATASWMIVDTEAAAATDDLDTINGGVEGRRIFIRTQNASRDITIKHATGNLRLPSSADFTLLNRRSYVEGIYNGTESVWCLIGHTIG